MKYPLYLDTDVCAIYDKVGKHIADVSDFKFSELQEILQNSNKYKELLNKKK